MAHANVVYSENLLEEKVLVPSNKEKLLHLASREQAGKTRDCQKIIIAIEIMEKF